MVERVVAGIHASRPLTALRDTLLPKLLSGELRVGDAEKVVEDTMARKIRAQALKVYAQAAVAVPTGIFSPITKKRPP